MPFSTLLVLVAVACGPLAHSTAVATTTTRAPAATTTTTPPPVMLYGDSIGYEIAPYLKRKLQLRAKRNVVARVFGGTNACDWLGTAKEDRIVYKPKYVVVIFTGNAFTQCVGFVGQLPTMVQRIDRTLDGIKQLMATLKGSHFFLLGFARSIKAQADKDRGLITTMDLLNWRLARLALDTGSTYVSATRVLYDANGRAQMKLPCTLALDGWMCGPSGLVTVRAPDGGHLCPITTPAVLGVLPGCKFPSPGANRFATLVADAIMKRIATG